MLGGVEGVLEVLLGSLVAFIVDDLCHSFLQAGLAERISRRCLDVRVDDSLTAYQVWNIVVARRGVRFIRQCVYHKVISLEGLFVAVLS